MVGAYCYVETPIGRLFLATSERGVVRLGFAGESQALAAATADLGGAPRQFAEAVNEQETGAESGPQQEHLAPEFALLQQAARELQEYFAGTRTKFEVPIDLRLGGFRGQIVKDLAAIPFGERSTYGQLAQRANNPGAVRAVGSACAHNPIPIFLPCHRVVRSDGSWGKYRGGEEAKTYLLNFEYSRG